MNALFLLLVIPLFTAPAHAGGPESKPIPIAPAKKHRPCPRLNLFKALETKSTACMEEALHHMSPTETNLRGDSPLHSAIRAKNRAALNFLLRHGADLNQRNQDELTPRELAENYGFRKLADYLGNMEKETERLFYAVDDDDLSAANSALLRGASMSTTNSRQDTPLHRASQSNLPEMAQLLLRYGAPVNARNYLGETPLHAAALRDFKAVMKILLAAGANASALNQRRETPRDFIEAKGDEETLKLLKAYHGRHGSRADVSLELSGGEGQDIEASVKP
jgi:ankyrin repeat protein